MEKKRTVWFNVLMVIMLLILASLLYRGIMLYVTNDYLFRDFLNVEAPEMPSWYPITTIIFAIISLVGLGLTYMYRKIGVYLVLGSLFLATCVQPEFMPDGTLLTLFALFFFFGYGLAILYPHWKTFK
ncbi:hypothetical protein ACF3NR_00615 [Vaginella massiliensis]|uniref:hypothetical protein n=1 Tax=Vaginella massiliensis TaxID=1816680 RepID=UPI0008382B3E|nr:hypothetical protein [Vaginella massiliensis]